jgi:energy-coupling factor transport system permease protein
VKAFDGYNPIAVFVYFAAVISLSMAKMNPIIILLSAIGAFVTFFVRNRFSGGASHLFFLLMFAVTVFINPLFNHNGATVLLVINDNPITLEATLYGIVSGLMIIGIIYWFRTFSQIMTSDKLLYLLGSVSPKFALILSMTLRYIPLFEKQTQKVIHAQQALGLYKDNDLVGKIRGGIRVFSVMVTWVLENGVITSDSMTARGYGIKRRTHFSIFKFRRQDIVLTATTIILFAVILTGILLGSVDFRFYPAIVKAESDIISFITYISYGILAFLPTITEAEEKIRWKYLKSKI